MSGELFVEVRCEELPAAMIGPALEGLRKGVLEPIHQQAPVG